MDSFASWPWKNVIQNAPTSLVFSYFWCEKKKKIRKKRLLGNPWTEKFRSFFEISMQSYFFTMIPNIFFSFFSPISSDVMIIHTFCWRSIPPLYACALYLVNSPRCGSDLLSSLPWLRFADCCLCVLSLLVIGSVAVPFLSLWFFLRHDRSCMQGKAYEATLSAVWCDHTRTQLD